nr:Scr1 family TA system antitoxin-like transcriptional regulator [Streptomyces niveiscabiei]
MVLDWEGWGALRTGSTRPLWGSLFVDAESADLSVRYGEHAEFRREFEYEEEAPAVFLVEVGPLGLRNLRRGVLHVDHERGPDGDLEPVALGVFDGVGGEFADEEGTEVGVFAAGPFVRAYGPFWPEPKELKTLLRVFQADTETRVRLETMLEEGRAISGAWWTEYQDEFAESLIEFIAYEDTASHIATCAANVIPGLLQTADYGRALTSASSSLTVAALRVERAIEVRQARRGVFDKPALPTVEAIVGEAALRQRIGGKDVMRLRRDDRDDLP